MNDLYLLKYNNYYNRQFKKENSIANYKTASTANYGPIANVNFNKNDGISARQIINFPVGQAEFEGDYLIITEANSETIVSRWFILENRWNRNGQLELTLRRDLLVDYYDKYKNQPFFCDRGALGIANSGTPDFGLFNPENIQVSKPLKQKSLIYDSTKTPWILLFVAKDSANTFGVFSEDKEQPAYRPSSVSDFINFWPSDPQAKDAPEAFRYQIYYPQREVSKTPIRHTQGASYDILALPLYGSYTIDANTYTIDAKTALDIASSLIVGFGSALYDAQLVPYFPDLDFDGSYGVSSDGRFFLNPGKLNSNYCLVRGVYQGAVKDPYDIIPLFFLGNYEGSTTVNLPVSWSKATPANYAQYQPDLAMEWKVEHITTKCRINAPNYSSSFEFTIPAVGGCSSSKTVPIQIKYTYKPYQSYIKLNPKFTTNSLYGSYTINNAPAGYTKTETDVRGCIIQGDMTLPQTTDPWREYMIQNKNFNNSFNRDIGNMEKQHNLQMIESGVGGLAGAATMGGTGAMIGSMVAPGIGTAVGAGIGALAGIVSGIADFGLARESYKENLDYTKDKFGYNLDNIKALPITLSTLSSFDIDNSIFPNFEVYQASATDIQAVRNKIKYDGMTVGRVASTFQAVQDKATTNCPYIRGKLIRSTNIGEDFHTLNELGLELNKGAYFK